MYRLTDLTGYVTDLHSVVKIKVFLNNQKKVFRTIIFERLSLKMIIELLF